MTNQEAIEAIKLARSQVEWDYPMDYAAAFDKAIEALEQEPTLLSSELEKNSKKLEKDFGESDCISRVKVIDYLCKHCPDDGECFEDCDEIKHLRNMPPVTPQEPKTGHWIMTGDYYTGAYGSIDYVECSCCHEDSLEEGDFCPNCGAKMVEPQESGVEDGNDD